MQSSILFFRSISLSRTFSIYFLLLGMVTVLSCKRNIPPQDTTPLITSQFSGTGLYTFTGYAPLANKPVEVYYHIPEQAHSASPILMVFHGAGRDGEYSRNALIDKADQYGVILVAPTFSSNYYNTNAYHLGNVFDNGEEPSPATLHPDSLWTYALIEPLFREFAAAIGSEEPYFDAFGFSAGGQFVHRMVTFMPVMHYNRAVAASSGWYTLPDSKVDYPYGTGQTGIPDLQWTDLFQRKVFISVGEKDTDYGSAGLRHTTEADAQGLNRYDRSLFYFQECQQVAARLSASFNWKWLSVPDANHDFVANARHVADLLYQP